MGVEMGEHLGGWGRRKKERESGEVAGVAWVWVKTGSRGPEWRAASGAVGAAVVPPWDLRAEETPHWTCSDNHTEILN